MTRNQRRAACKARHNAKLVRIAKAAKAFDASQRQAIVTANLNSPRPERNLYPRSCLADMAGQSHRGYICQAGGAMPRQRAMALKARGSW